VQEKRVFEFNGSLNRLAIDSEGESKITLSVPALEILNAAQLALFTEKLLKIKIEVIE
jgi:hypothetical protein